MPRQSAAGAFAQARLDELDVFRQDSRLEAVDVDQPEHRLAKAAARFLGPIRTAVRYDMRLPAVWNAGANKSRTEDISASGALIALEAGDRPATGERLELELAATDTPLRLPSEVVRTTEATDDKVRGFAVSWVGADAEQLRRLDEYLATQT